MAPRDPNDPTLELSGNASAAAGDDPIARAEDRAEGIQAPGKNYVLEDPVPNQGVSKDYSASEANDLRGSASTTEGSDNPNLLSDLAKSSHATSASNPQGNPNPTSGVDKAAGAADASFGTGKGYTGPGGY